MQKLSIVDSVSMPVKKEENTEMTILWTLWFKSENDVEGKINSIFNQENQGKKKRKKLKTNSDKKLPTASLGAAVRVSISDVDKEQENLRNLFSVIVSVAEDFFYWLGTSGRIFKQLYA